jgi:uncharacterized protein (TIGR01777 family)
VLWSSEGGVSDAHRLADCEAVVHLAGENIAGGLRWTRAKKQRILASRVDATRRLVETLARLPHPPHTFVCASAVGIYGDRGDEILTEASPPAESGFLPMVSMAWEREAARAADAGMRVAMLRFGIVLGSDGGALAKMLPLFRWGLGGRLGSGAQWWSWITLGDAVRAIGHILADAHLAGPVNICAPAPVTNAVFTRELSRALRRPALFHVPAFALNALMGELARETLLASARAVPEKLAHSGFEFADAELDLALARVLGQGQASRGT